LPEEWKRLDDNEKVDKLNEQAEPENVLDILVKSWVWGVREADANNPGVSENILRSIIETDDDEELIELAKNNLNKLVRPKGAELLAKIEELGDLSKTDLARGCGYFTIKEDGSESINFNEWYEAILEAKGLK
tara:strand:- start:842 stop:1240 length:399 start_codon:yes stop_codon:yes gene_type:complete